MLVEEILQTWNFSGMFHQYYQSMSWALVALIASEAMFQQIWKKRTAESWDTKEPLKLSWFWRQQKLNVFHIV